MSKTVPTVVTQRFAKRLRATRGGRGFKTARKFAEALGIHENRYTRYERAEVEPDLETLMSICSALEVTPNDLLSETMGLNAEDLELNNTPGFTDNRVTSFESEPVGASLASIQDPFKTEAMALAMELGAILARRDAGGAEPATFEAIKVGTSLYPKFSTAPLEAIADIGTKIDISMADLETQARVAGHITKLIEKLRQ